MPLSRCNVLIVEDQAIIALDLQAAVEEANAQVIGPAPTVREALDLLDTDEIHAAILDANLPDGDITPVAEELIDRGVPFVINTGVAVPLNLRRFPDLPVFRKPTPASRLIRELAGRLPVCLAPRTARAGAVLG
ncbi:MAG TPA: response regulator [Beijerinckiaceae bacterium]|jgi:CheY-like chemotaxis protein